MGEFSPKLSGNRIVAASFQNRFGLNSKLTIVRPRVRNRPLDSWHHLRRISASRANCLLDVRGTPYGKLLLSKYLSNHSRICSSIWSHTSISKSWLYLRGYQFSNFGKSMKTEGFPLSVCEMIPDTFQSPLCIRESEPALH